MKDDIDKWVAEQSLHFSGKRFGTAADVDWRLFEYLLPALPAKILDVGCNSGCVTIKLRQRGYDAYGVDLPAVINKALEILYKDAHGYLIPCNLEYDELPGQDYDLILAIGVFEHIMNYDKLLYKMAQALKVNGILYMCTCYRPAIQTEPYHCQHFTDHDLEDMGKKVSLQMIKCEVRRTSLRATFRKVESLRELENYQCKVEILPEGSI